MRCSVKQQENVQFYAFQPAFNFNHHCLECLSLTHFGLHLTNIHDTQQFVARCMSSLGIEFQQKFFCVCRVGVDQVVVPV